MTPSPTLKSKCCGADFTIKREQVSAGQSFYTCNACHNDCETVQQPTPTSKSLDGIVEKVFVNLLKQVSMDSLTDAQTDIKEAIKSAITSYCEELQKENEKLTDLLIRIRPELNDLHVETECKSQCGVIALLTEIDTAIRNEKGK